MYILNVFVCINEFILSFLLLCSILVYHRYINSLIHHCCVAWQWQHFKKKDKTIEKKGVTLNPCYCFSQMQYCKQLTSFIILIYFNNKKQNKNEWIEIFTNKYNKLVTVVEGNPRAPFSIATTPMCRGGCYSFPWTNKYKFLKVFDLILLDNLLTFLIKTYV